MNTFVRFTENGYKQLKEENSRLHDVIKHLIAENEEHEDALAELQERYDELKEVKINDAKTFLNKMCGDCTQFLYADTDTIRR